MIYKSKVTLPTGAVVNSSELVSLTKLAKKCGKTRQSLQSWADGEGRGSRATFVCVEIDERAFSTEALLDDFLKKTDPSRSLDLGDLERQVESGEIEVDELRSVFDDALKRLEKLKKPDAASLRAARKAAKHSSEEAI